MLRSIPAAILKYIGWSIACAAIATCGLQPSLFAQAKQESLASVRVQSSSPIKGHAAPSSQACQARVNDSSAKLLECIQQDSLWNHLSHFQKIANQNKGQDGHGYRDTGTPGYKASVDYVAGLMRQAGYHVTIQTYQLTASQVARMPRLAEQDMRGKAVVDYNLIAESPFGDPKHTVVVDAHLDSIFGAGMLDNASGSTTILDIALNMAKTSTLNRLRYIWFGGEELGLLGSAYYTQHLTSAQRKVIAFDIDVDVTATPNFDILVADPADAFNVGNFPKNVVPQSKIGNNFFKSYFTSIGVPSQSAWFGNSGTDSNSFALIGIPDSGILTEQDCCKQQSEVDIWGGFLGNYEGTIPGDDGGCVDRPNLWCDNLSNNDPFILGMVSKGTANVVFKMANHPFKTTHP